MCACRRVKNVPFFGSAKVPGCQDLRLSLQPWDLQALWAGPFPTTPPLGAWPRERSELASEKAVGKDSLKNEVRDLGPTVFHTLGVGASRRGCGSFCWGTVTRRAVVVRGRETWKRWRLSEWWGWG